jgi:hypothetical protein
VRAIASERAERHPYFLMNIFQIQSGAHGPLVLLSSCPLVLLPMGPIGPFSGHLAESDPKWLTWPALDPATERKKRKKKTKENSPKEKSERKRKESK